MILRYTHSTWLLFRCHKMILEACTCTTCNLCRQYHFTLHLNKLILTRFVQHDFKVQYLHKLKSFSTISLHTTHALLHSFNLISGFYTCTTWNLHLFGKMTYFTLHLHTQIFLRSPNFPGFFILGMCVILHLHISYLYLCLKSRPKDVHLRISIFLAQLWMAASNHFINKCNKKIRQVKI